MGKLSVTTNAAPWPDRVYNAGVAAECNGFTK